MNKKQRGEIITFLCKDIDRRFPNLMDALSYIGFHHDEFANEIMYLLKDKSRDDYRTVMEFLSEKFGKMIAPIPKFDEEEWIKSAYDHFLAFVSLLYSSRYHNFDFVDFGQYCGKSYLEYQCDDTSYGYNPCVTPMRIPDDSFPWEGERLVDHGGYIVEDAFPNFSNSIYLTIEGWVCETMVRYNFVKFPDSSYISPELSSYSNVASSPVPSVSFPNWFYIDEWMFDPQNISDHDREDFERFKTIMTGYIKDTPKLEEIIDFLLRRDGKILTLPRHKSGKNQGTFNQTKIREALAAIGIKFGKSQYSKLLLDA